MAFWLSLLVTGLQLFFFFFNWRITALQCCVGFCCTSIRMSHNYMYISSLLNFPCPCPIPPLQVTKHQAGLPMLYSSFPLIIYLTHGTLQSCNPMNCSFYNIIWDSISHCISASLHFLPHMGCRSQCNTAVYYYPSAMFKIFSHKTVASLVV